MLLIGYSFHRLPTDEKSTHPASPFNYNSQRRNILAPVVHDEEVREKQTPS
jgi:hypothetical protein